MPLWISRETVHGGIRHQVVAVAVVFLGVAPDLSRRVIENDHQNNQNDPVQNGILLEQLNGFHNSSPESPKRHVRI